MHARIRAANREANPGAEGESSQAERDARIAALHLVKRRAHVVGLAMPLVVVACAATDTTKVEAECWHIELHQRLSDAEDNLVMHRAAKPRVRVTDDGGHRGWHG